MSNNNDNNLTVYMLKDIDKTVWRMFKAKCLIAGFNTAGDGLKKLIVMFVGDEIDVKE